MLNMAKLYMINDVNVINQMAMGGVKVVTISEFPQQGQFVNSDNILKGSILLPPYEIISLLVDGDMNRFNEFYRQYLLQKDSDEFLCAIFTALMSGIPIALYIDNEELSGCISNALMCYLAAAFGVIVESPNSAFLYDTRFNALNLEKLFVYDLITWQEFFMRYPENIDFSKIVIYKLINQINPATCVTNPTVDDYKRELVSIRNNMKNAGRILINPLEQVKEISDDYIYNKC